MAIENVIYNTRAIIEMKTEMDYVTALSYLFKALEIDDSIGNMASRWTHLYNISTLYSFKGDYSSALEYAKMAYRRGIQPVQNVP